MNSNTKHTGGRRIGVMIAAALLGVAMIAISVADTQAQSTFTVNISEKEQKLAHPTDMMWDKHLMWDLGFQRMNDRNMPYVELRNTGTAPITEYRMTIGDTRFNFTNESLGTYALLGSTTPGFQLTSNAISGDELVVMIGNGGLPVGQLVRFKIDLGVDPPNSGGLFEFPDFRTVLFDMNGVQVYDSGMPTVVSSTDNSRISVVFDPPTGANFATTPVFLADATVPAPANIFFNDARRQWGENDPVRIFSLTGGGIIPEPSSAVLLAGVACGLATWRRRRKRARAKTSRGRAEMPDSGAHGAARSKRTGPARARQSQSTSRKRHRRCRRRVSGPSRRSSAKNAQRPNGSKLSYRRR